MMCDWYISLINLWLLLYAGEENFCG